jgi:hypothetical protein
MNRRLIGVVLLLGMATLTACSSTSSGDAASPAMAEPYEARDAPGSGESKSTGQGDQPAAAKDITQPGLDRTLVRTATIELSTADVGETVDRARDIALTEGGYAGREEVRAESATLTLHIPSDRFDQALDGLSELGEVTSRDQTAEDVTEQVVDLDSRIATQRASVDRVRALLARASTVEEIVRIEQELTTRESDLESLQQRRQALGGQAAMSTVTIRFSRTTTSAAPVAEDESSGFLAGLSDGWDAFLGFGAGTLRVIGALLPFLLLFAIPAVPAIRWWRRRRAITTAVAQQPVS